MAVAIDKVAIDRFIHRPRNEMYAKLDRTQCAFRCSRPSRLITDFFQCGKAIVEHVEGYGFCASHALKVKGAMGIATATAMKFYIKRLWANWEITPVEILKETASTVVLADGSRVSKSDQYGEYFDTWEQARERLTEIVEKRVDSARRELTEAMDARKKVQELTR